jgi:uncharacterized protein YndB with AHSA1/START domain
MRSNKNSARSEYTIVITRKFNGSPARVFEAWTDTDKVSRWWGPRGFTASVCKIDLQEGGEYHYCVRSPEGMEYWTKGIFNEIVSGKRIVATDLFSDINGNIIPAAAVGLPEDWPSTLLWTVDFELADQQTKLTLRHMGLPPEMVESCRAGWNESFDKLALLLSKY